MLRSISLVTTALLVLAACSDTPSAPESAGSADRPASPGVTPAAETLSGFLNGPESPGNSGVFRFQDVFVVITTDPDRDVFAVHAQADDLFLCGGDSDFELSDIQFVENQETFIRMLLKLEDAPIFLYRNSDPEPDLCKFLNENWLYNGTHSLVQTDNNLDAFLNDRGANSFGWAARGTVYDKEGNRCKYHEHQNAVWSPDRSSLEWKNEDITVNCQGPR